MVLEKPEVERVTVIEKSEDVIVLVAPSFSKDNRVQIILADAFEYQPPKGVRYGAVWHDIWDTICGDNLPSMHRLHRKYGRRTEWQNSWCRELCERSR
jgi:spermidine synthase